MEPARYMFIPSHSLVCEALETLHVNKEWEMVAYSYTHWNQSCNGSSQLPILFHTYPRDVGGLLGDS